MQSNGLLNGLKDYKKSLLESYFKSSTQDVEENIKKINEKYKIYKEDTSDNAYLELSYANTDLRESIAKLRSRIEEYNNNYCPKDNTGIYQIPKHDEKNLSLKKKENNND